MVFYLGYRGLCFAGHLCLQTLNKTQTKWVHITDVKYFSRVWIGGVNFILSCILSSFYLLSICYNLPFRFCRLQGGLISQHGCTCVSPPIATTNNLTPNTLGWVRFLCRPLFFKRSKLSRCFQQTITVPLGVGHQRKLQITTFSLTSKPLPIYYYTLVSPSIPPSVYLCEDPHNTWSPCQNTPLPMHHCTIS